MILEVWGNGTDVIIKFTKDMGGIWYAASKWPTVNSPFMPKGYRRLKWPV